MQFPRSLVLPRFFALSFALSVFGGSPLQAALRVSPLDKVQVGQKAEFRLEDVPAATNPFDPSLIRVDAVFTTPAGRTLTIPAFWYQNFSRELNLGQEVLKPVGGAWLAYSVYAH